jgi:hypothetical protein
MRHYYDVMGKLVLLRLSLAGNMEKSPNGGRVATDSVMTVMKSNTVTRFKIISGIRNSLQIIGGFLYAATSSLKRVTEKDFHN